MGVRAWWPPWSSSGGNGSSDRVLHRLESAETQLHELERIASLSAAQARQALVEEVEDEARRQAGLALRQIEDETKLES